VGCAAGSTAVFNLVDVLGQPAATRSAAVLIFQVAGFEPTFQNRIGLPASPPRGGGGVQPVPVIRWPGPLPPDERRRSYLSG